MRPEETMDTNVNLDALIASLALMAVCGLIFVAAIALVFSIVQRKSALAGAALIAMVTIGAIYLGLLLVFSFRSGDKLLARGEEKILLRDGLSPCVFDYGSARNKDPGGPVQSR